MLRLCSLVGVALLLSSALVAQPDPGAEATGGRKGLGLTSPLFQEFDTGPGSTFEGRVLIQNNTAEPQTVRLYQMDYVLSADGLTGAYIEVSDEVRPRSNLSWVRVPRSEVTVFPGETETIPYEVQIPADTVGALAGTYWSVIFAEPLTGGERTVETEAGTTFRILQRVRYGTHVATHVGSDAVPSLSVLGTSLAPDPDGGYLLTADFANSGLRSTRPRFWVELYDGEGALTGRFEGRPPVVYPGLIQSRAVAIGDVPSGSYQGVLYVEDENEITGYRLTLDL